MHLSGSSHAKPTHPLATCRRRADVRRALIPVYVADICLPAPSRPDRAMPRLRPPDLLLQSGIAIRGKICRWPTHTPSWRDDPQWPILRTDFSSKVDEILASGPSLPILASLPSYDSMFVGKRFPRPICGTALVLRIMSRPPYSPLLSAAGSHRLLSARQKAYRESIHLEHANQVLRPRQRTT
jgi:hypothetical protein